ncbi:uncharacterized protein LOC102806585 [Saccoglossus kowalevskii]
MAGKPVYMRGISSLNSYVAAMKNIPYKSMKTFARQLGLEENEINEIERKCINQDMTGLQFETYTTWKTKYGRKAKAEVFAKALHDIGYTADAEDLLEMEANSSNNGTTPKTSNGTTPKTSEQLKEMQCNYHFNKSCPGTWIVTVGIVAIIAMIIVFNGSLYYSIIFAFIGFASIVVMFVHKPVALTNSRLQTGLLAELPEASSFFTGREHKEYLSGIYNHYRQLRAKHRITTPTSALVEILYGLGGCGKTEIMTQYIKTHLHEYRGGVFVINGQSRSFLDFGFRKMLKVNISISTRYGILHM